MKNEAAATQDPEFRIPLLGRSAETSALLNLLRQDDVRLLTLTGTAGIGKTRLALAVAEQAKPLFAQTVILDLTAVKKAGQVFPAVAQAIDLRTSSAGQLARRLAEAVGSVRLLLVLDNCEHVLGIKTELEVLLGCCPNLKVLATSQVLFRSKWELVFPVGPLPVPGPGSSADLSSLSRVPSVALFVLQAQSRFPGFALTEENAPVLAELCGRLDGLPLAILLAAGRVETQDLSGVLALPDSVPAEKNDAGRLQGRHTTLETALDWGFSLLTGEEKVLFRRLSVFQGPWTAQEAVGVCSWGSLQRDRVPALLGRLADASLIQVNRSSGRGKHFRFLETVRAYAGTKLKKSGEEKELCRRHRDWFMVWAEQGEPGIWGPEAPEWLEQLELNYADLWAAMKWSLDTPGEAGDGLRLWASAVGFYDLRGRVPEGLAMAEKLLAGSGTPTPARARTLVQYGVLMRSQGNLDGARAAAAECLSFAAGLGDTFDSIAALCTLGSLDHIQGNEKEAGAVFQKACVLARNCFESEPRSLYVSLFWLGLFCCFQCRYSQAEAVLMQALQAARQQGCVLFESRLLAVLGRALLGMGRLEQAESVLIEGIFAARRLKYHEITAICFDYLGQLAWGQRQKKRAVRFLSAAWRLRRHVGVVFWFPDREHARIMAELGAGELERAVPADCLLPEQITLWALEILGARAGRESDLEAEKLTLREREVCRLVTQGLGNREIAQRLQISRRTADAHIRHILVKLDLNTRAQISAWYARHCSAAE